MNVLLVEDEARVADFIQRGLKAEGWSVSVAPTGESALVMIADGLVHYPVHRRHDATGIR